MFTCSWGQEHSFLLKSHLQSKTRTHANPTSVLVKGEKEYLIFLGLFSNSIAQPPAEPTRVFPCREEQRVREAEDARRAEQARRTEESRLQSLKISDARVRQTAAENDARMRAAAQRQAAALEVSEVVFCGVLPTREEARLVAHTSAAV